jgi:hypothetical protein
VNWTNSVPIELLLGLALLGFLVWELRNLRRTQRIDREKAREAEPKALE